MTTSFIYRPHVHTADGVLTPDLAIDRLWLADGLSGGRVPLSVNLLSTDTSLQDVSAGGCASAALVLVSAGRGTLATVGSAHWVPGAASGGGPPSEQYSAKPLAREAVRLDRLAAAGARPFLQTWRIDDAGEEQIGETPIADLAGAAAAIEEWSGAVPRGTAVFVSARHADPAPVSAERYSVRLAGVPDCPDVILAYRVERLSR